MTHLILVLSSCLLTISINIAFKTDQYFAGNLLLTMLITSIFRHSTNVIYHENKIIYQYWLSYITDLLVVHSFGLYSFLYIIINFNARRLISFFLFLIVANVYWFYLAHRKYTIRECIMHAAFIHYTGNVATILMLAPNMKYIL